MRYVLSCCIVCLGCADILARPVPRHKDYLDLETVVAEGGTIEPAAVPLKVRLIANKIVYHLDRGGRTDEKYREHLDQARKTGQLPPAPQIDVVFELENTGTQEIQLLVGGDAAGALRLHVTGPGAVSIMHRPAVQADDFKAATIVKIPPGGRHRWTFNTLDSSGARDVCRAYWTQPGEYMVSAGFMVAVRPTTIRMVPHWYHKDHGNVAISSGSVRLVVLEKPR